MFAEAAAAIAGSEPQHRAAHRDDSDNVAQLSSLVASYPDWPTKGVLFRDIFPIFQSPTVSYTPAHRQCACCCIQPSTLSHAFVYAVATLPERCAKATARMFDLFVAHIAHTHGSVDAIVALGHSRTEHTRR